MCENEIGQRSCKQKESAKRIMIFFELLQIAIGNRDRLSQNPTEERWEELFAQARRQAMVGIAFRGVEQLSEEQRPQRSLLMRWYMATERIKTMNADLDRKALAVANKFLDDGFPGVVLKGQGKARLYRTPRGKSLFETMKAKGLIVESGDGCFLTDYGDQMLTHIHELFMIFGEEDLVEDYISDMVEWYQKRTDNNRQRYHQR